MHGQEYIAECTSEFYFPIRPLNIFFCFQWDIINIFSLFEIIIPPNDTIPSGVNSCKRKSEWTQSVRLRSPREMGLKSVYWSHFGLYVPVVSFHWAAGPFWIMLLTLQSFSENWQPSVHCHRRCKETASAWPASKIASAQITNKGGCWAEGLSSLLHWINSPSLQKIHYIWFSVGFPLFLPTIHSIPIEFNERGRIHRALCRIGWLIPALQQRLNPWRVMVIPQLDVPCSGFDICKRNKMQLAQQCHGLSTQHWLTWWPLTWQWIMKAPGPESCKHPHSASLCRAVSVDSSSLIQCCRGNSQQTIFLSEPTSERRTRNAVQSLSVPIAPLSQSN